MNKAHELQTKHECILCVHFIKLSFEWKWWDDISHNHNDTCEWTSHMMHIQLHTTHIPLHAMPITLHTIHITPHCITWYQWKVISFQVFALNLVQVKFNLTFMYVNGIDYSFYFIINSKNLFKRWKFRMT
jgi:hypothetical protein